MNEIIVAAMLGHYASVTVNPRMLSRRRRCVAEATGILVGAKEVCKGMIDANGRDIAIEKLANYLSPGWKEHGTSVF